MEMPMAYLDRNYASWFPRYKEFVIKGKKMKLSFYMRVTVDGNESRIIRFAADAQKKEYKKRWPDDILRHTTMVNPKTGNKEAIIYRN